MESTAVFFEAITSSTPTYTVCIQQGKPPAANSCCLLWTYTLSISASCYPVNDCRWMLTQTQKEPDSVAMTSAMLCWRKSIWKSFTSPQCSQWHHFHIVFLFNSDIYADYVKETAQWGCDLPKLKQVCGCKRVVTAEDNNKLHRLSVTSYKHQWRWISVFSWATASRSNGENRLGVKFIPYIILSAELKLVATPTYLCRHPSVHSLLVISKLRKLQQPQTVSHVWMWSSVWCITKQLTLLSEMGWHVYTPWIWRSDADCCRH